MHDRLLVTIMLLCSFCWGLKSFCIPAYDDSFIQGGKAHIIKKDRLSARIRRVIIRVFAAVRMGIAVPSLPPYGNPRG